MLRLLIAEPSEIFAGVLKQRLQADMEIRVCRDGCEALEQLYSFRPDVMVLNLQLPRKDGLSLLRQTDFLPRVVLGVTGFASGEICQTAYALGVDRLMLIPSVNTLVTALLTMVQQAKDPERKQDIREQARFYLQTLNFAPHLDGYKQLCVALPLFAADPEQTLSKELYPAVAKILDCADARSVEHSIRMAIAHAWETRDMALWEGYFPKAQGCPNNKRFLAKLCEMMK